MDAIIVAIVSYLIGSLPFAVIISRVYNLGDITKFGSGNPGATNMLRLGGKKLAAGTFLLDAAKGGVAVWLAAMFNQENIAYVAVILGHCFALFLKFKGGKGVATNFGALLVLSPLMGVVCLALWAATFMVFRISSASALVAVNLSVILSFIIAPEISYVMLITAILITYRHKSNIQKLLEGMEK